MTEHKKTAGNFAYGMVGLGRNDEGYGGGQLE